jgi:hypothetical protein
MFGYIDENAKVIYQGWQPTLEDTLGEENAVDVAIDSSSFSMVLDRSTGELWTSADWTAEVKKRLAALEAQRR